MNLRGILDGKWTIRYESILDILISMFSGINKCSRSEYIGDWFRFISISKIRNFINLHICRISRLQRFENQYFSLIFLLMERAEWFWHYMEAKHLKPHPRVAVWSQGFLNLKTSDLRFSTQLPILLKILIPGALYNVRCYNNRVFMNKILKIWDHQLFSVPQTQIRQFEMSALASWSCWYFKHRRFWHQMEAEGLSPACWGRGRCIDMCI